MALSSLWFFLLILQGGKGMYDNYSIHFEEDLRFGGGDRDEYNWLESASANVMAMGLPSGEILVMDPGNSRVLLFDSLGRFVKYIAKEGDGPGEFRGLIHFQITKNGAVGLEQTRGRASISYFSKDFVFQNKKQLPNRYRGMMAGTVSNRGDLAMLVFELNPHDGSYIYRRVLVDSSFKEINEFYKYTTHLTSKIDFNKPSAWVDRLAKFLKYFVHGTGNHIFLPDNSVLYASPNRYLIEKFEAENNVKGTLIMRDDVPEIFSDEEKLFMVDLVKDWLFAGNQPQLDAMLDEGRIQTAIEQAELPRFKKPIFGLFSVDAQSIAVISDMNLITGRIVLDFFEINGNYLGRTPFPGRRLVTFLGARLSFGGGKAYAVERSEDDENQIVRYGLRIEQ